MVSVCLLSDTLSQHLPSYLGFSYNGRGISLHSCSSKAQPLLFNLDERYVLTIAPPDLECGVAPLGPSVPSQPKPCHVGPPKMGGSWWRGLTECGPLEKGMANHFSILALRTP